MPGLATARWRPDAIAEPEALPVSRRAITLAVIILVHLLLVWLLVTINPEFAKMGRPPGAMEMIAIPDPAKKPSPAKSKAAKSVPKQAVKATRAPPIDTSKTPDKALFGVQLFEAIDITKLPNHREDLAQADASVSENAGRGDSVAVTGPGGGPNGQTLYQAEWQREPTDAELRYYLPRGAPRNSWAVIACRTAERFRVEDCYILGDAPGGSGLGEAIRQAAWQFRVLPPRINGKPQIGSWVRIRISFSERQEDPS